VTIETEGTAAGEMAHHMMRPPYVDPNTQICYDSSNPEFEGWLTKQSMWLKVRRFCVAEILMHFEGIRKFRKR